MKITISLYTVAMRIKKDITHTQKKILHRKPLFQGLLHSQHSINI